MKFLALLVMAFALNTEATIYNSKAIVHPEVARHFDQWLSQQSCPYVIKEVAILFEIGIEIILLPRYTDIER